jgi:heat shock protein HslJ
MPERLWIGGPADFRRVCAEACVKSLLFLSIIGLVVVTAACQRKQGAESGAGTGTADNAAQSADAPAASPMGAADTLGTGPWGWVATQTPVEWIASPDPARYTVSFAADSAVSVRADCNRGHGSYHVDGSAIHFGPLATTRMMCPPGSKDGVFLQQLEAARHWFTREDTLMMDLLADSGTMRFVKVEAGE